MLGMAFLIDDRWTLGDPDYKLKCIGFWKENLKSYLITYDELDAFSKYRCWVRRVLHEGNHVPVSVTCFYDVTAVVSVVL